MKIKLMILLVSVCFFVQAQTEETETEKKSLPETEEELISPVQELQTQPAVEKEVLKEEMKLEEGEAASPAEMKLPSSPVELKAEPVPGAEIYLEQSAPEEVKKKPAKKKKVGTQTE